MKVYAVIVVDKNGEPTIKHIVSSHSVAQNAADHEIEKDNSCRVFIQFINFKFNIDIGELNGSYK